MSVQVIEKEGKPEYAVIPYSEYERLLELAEELADQRAFDKSLDQDEETLSHEMVRRLVEGENPIRAWRRHRGLTQGELAKRVGRSQSFIAMVEKGDRQPAVPVLARIAQALDVDLDDLV